MADQHISSNRSADTGLREGFQGAIVNDTPVAPMKVDLGTPQADAREIKRLAQFFGADLCGIPHIDLRGQYTQRRDTKTMKPVPNLWLLGKKSKLIAQFAWGFARSITTTKTLSGIGL